MNGWGRIGTLTGLAVFVSAACGGRTETLSDAYDEGSAGAAGASAGRASGGTPGFGGAGVGYGGTPVGGAVSYAGYAGYPSFGGSVGYAGYPSFGGSVGYAGYPSFGGSVGYAGFPGYAGAFGYGGAAIGGGFGVAGYGGGTSIPGGDCCEEQDTASCRPRQVARCVCDYLPYCCDTQWNTRCAGLVEPLGCGNCQRSCLSCLYGVCSVRLNACLGDLGCFEIFGCARASGCQGFDCYSPSTCQGVIDAWGGPGGTAMSLLLDAVGCAVSAGCSCN